MILIHSKVYSERVFAIEKVKSLAVFTLGGILQATLVISALVVAAWYFPPLSMVSSALFALVVLREGVLKGSQLATLTIGVLMFASAYLHNSPIEGVLLGGLVLLPVFPAAYVLRESMRLDWAFNTTMLLGVLVVLMFYLVAGNPADFWLGKIHAFTQELPESPLADLDDGLVEKVQTRLAQVMTGIVVAGTVLSTYLALLLARWQQALLFNPGEFRKEFVRLRLNELIVYSALLTLSLSLLLTGTIAAIALNLTLVLAITFLMAGFAVIHGVMGVKSHWLVVVYITLFLFPQLMLPPITLLGFSDNWIDWRNLRKTS